MKFGYRRVSALDQSLARQDLPNDCDRIFEEKVSGKNADRVQLNILRDLVGGGDEIVVHSIDRLARSSRDLQAIVDDVVEKGARITFLKESLSFGGGVEDPMSKLMMQVLGAISEFERELIRQRQKEGIAKAKAAGRYKGRPKSINRSLAKKLFDAGAKPVEVADTMQIGIASAYRLRKELTNLRCET
ncbi:MAG: recombinase family protein [Shimia thalassica]|uniref:recombinase family protein n=1 Tax=Shimia thalassica TaxID=1715693 RepID=UPI0032968102